MYAVIIALKPPPNCHFLLMSGAYILRELNPQLRFFIFGGGLRFISRPGPLAWDRTLFQAFVGLCHVNGRMQIWRLTTVFVTGPPPPPLPLLVRVYDPNHGVHVCAGSDAAGKRKGL